MKTAKKKIFTERKKIQRQINIENNREKKS